MVFQTENHISEGKLRRRDIVSTDPEPDKGYFVPGMSWWETLSIKIGHVDN